MQPPINTLHRLSGATQRSSNQTNDSTGITYQKDEFLKLVKQDGLSQSKALELWSLIHFVLYDSCCDPALVDVFFKKIVEVEQDQREEVLNTALPVCNLCESGEHKLMVLVLLCDVPQQLRTATADVLQFYWPFSANQEKLIFGLHLIRHELEGGFASWIEVQLEKKKQITELTHRISAEDAQIEKEIAKRFPALEEYQSFHRSSNGTQSTLHSGEVVTDRWQQSQKTSLDFALDVIRNNRTTVDKTDIFRKFLLGLGARNTCAAYERRSIKWEKFGECSQAGVFVPVQDQAANKADVIGSNTITINGEVHKLTSRDSTGVDYHYEEFWKMETPFSFVPNICSISLLTAQ